jgi:uncharacterized protein involved in exopolysaccharide biosynthesis
MADVTQPPGLPLWSDHMKFVRRHRVWIGALMGLGLVIGYAWSLTQPTSFSATASVAITPVPMYVTASTSELLPPPVTIDTDAQLLRSPSVRRAVATALGLKADATAGQHLSVSASANTDVLHVTVSARSAQAAADAANAAVAAFIQVRRHALGSIRTKELSHLRLAIDGEEHLLDRGVVLPVDNGLFAQVLVLQKRLQELEDARAQPGNLISPAVVPQHADYANTEVPVVSGAMLGFLLAWMLGIGLDRAPRRRPVSARAPLVPNPFGDLPDAAILHESYHHAV